jgi:hypothetical protein
MSPRRVLLFAAALLLFVGAAFAVGRATRTESSETVAGPQTVPATKQPTRAVTNITPAAGIPALKDEPADTTSGSGGTTDGGTTTTGTTGGGSGSAGGGGVSTGGGGGTTAGGGGGSSGGSSGGAITPAGGGEVDVGG